LPDNMEKEIQRFREFLKSRNLRCTRERRLILEFMLSGKGHLDALDIHRRLIEQGYNVSRATVYRTLHLLTQSGQVEKVHLGETHQHYEKSTGYSHHDHLICVRCGRIIEFFDPDLEKKQANIYRKYRFHAISHNLQVFGICSECHTKETGAEST